MRPAAFFDLDGTLITVNSGKLWMERERRVGRISRWQMVQAIFYLMLYKFGVINMDKAMRKALQTVKGLEEKTVQDWTTRWFHDEVVGFATREAFQALDSHRKQGLPLVLLTSSSPYESSVACEFFGIEHRLSTRYEVKDGKLTGEVLPPICYGQGKVQLAEAFCAEHDLDLDASYFYSDSITDLPMLERVGQPRVVNPDARLRRKAIERGWPVLQWNSEGGETGP